MRIRLRMLKHYVGKGRHIMKQLHVCLRVLQYYAIVATERAGYVLYRALVFDRTGLGQYHVVIHKKFTWRISTINSAGTHSFSPGLFHNVIANIM